MLDIVEKNGRILYPLSESQKSIWYLEKAYPGTSLNIVAGSLRLKNDFDCEAFGKAVNLFIRKNDAMRIRLVEEDGVARQYVSEYRKYELEYYDFSRKRGLEDLFAWDEEQTRKPFDIVDNDLYYFALFKISDSEGGGYLRMHHLISDAWTMGLVVKQLIAYYTAIKNGLPVDESLNPSFLEHLAGNEAYEKSSRFEADKAYWSKKFETLPEMTVLKPLKASADSIRARRKTLITPLKLSNKIREFCSANTVSVFTLFMSALSIYINRVTGLEDIVLGTTILNRTNTREKEATGMFVSVAAPVRISVSDTMDFVTFSKTMLKESTDILRHQKYPYNYLIRDLKKTHKLPGRLFDIVLSYQNAKFQKNESQEDYTARWHFSGYQVESLVISINDREDGGNLIIDYDFLTDVFEIKEIEFIHQHIISLLWHALDNPAKRISKLEMISEKEKHALLYEFNDTAAGYPEYKTLHRIFEERAAKTPDKAALVLDGRTMTYRQLNERANRLARTLRANGVGPDAVVGIMADKSFEMIAAILGVSKAGGAYMPIDPEFPGERRQYMLEDSGAVLLLTKKAFDGQYGVRTLLLDDAAIYDRDAADLTGTAKSTDLAYVIYTSGSTGRPKGVMTEHRNVTGLFLNDGDPVAFNDTDVWTFFHSYCFDMGLWEMYGALLLGGTLVLIPPEAAIDIRRYVEILKKEKVTVLSQTPQFVYKMLETALETDKNKLRLRYVCMGGEALKPALLKPFKEKYPDTAFYNLYGPTETTMYVTQKLLQYPEDFETSRSNIGSASPLTKAYIVDRNLNLLPIGIPGELCISGNGVSRGYINNPQMTHEKFIPSPFARNEVLYRTGDLARRMARGEIEYLGRTDDQVKIRGYRIELGEVENALLRHPEIGEAVVVVRELGGVKKLCAYYKADTEFSAEELNAYFSDYLPVYMLPSFYIKVGSFSLNANGKIDKKSLPEPQEKPEASEAVLPEGPVETALAGIWGQVLETGNIGVTDNFFYIGGDSLNAVSVATLVGKYLDAEISPRDLFRYPTIRELGAYIETLSKISHSPIEKIGPSAYYPVSSAQKRQYILNKIDGGVSYNVPGGLKIRGAVDPARLEAAFRSIIARHESLRTGFDLIGGEPVQIVRDTVDFSVEYRRAAEAGIEPLTASFVRPFDLSCPPLLRVALISLSDSEHVLLLDMHHIVSDGASLNILVGEFRELYDGGTLPGLRIQYKDYAAWHNALLKSEKVKKQEAYWLGKYSGELPVLELPLDHMRPSAQSFRGDRHDFVIDERLAESLRAYSEKTGVTLFMLLFSAYSVLLSRYTGQEDIVVGTPVEGRRHHDLNGLIGMFVNTLAVRSFPAGDKPFGAFLNEVKEDLLDAYDNQDYPFEALVDKVCVKRDMSRNPLIDTIFSFRKSSFDELAAADFTGEPYGGNNKTAKFDLSLEVVDNGGSLACVFEYCTDLLAGGTVARMSRHYVNALRSVVGNPEKTLSEIDILSEEERRQLLYDFNDTDADYPRAKTIHQIFEEQAEKTPDTIALVFRDRTMTYRELNEKANRLARTLRANGVGPDVIVGLILDRSPDMLVSILGVLKAGGAYMPLDPDYPEERIRYMLENSGADILLMRHNSMKADYPGKRIISLDDESSFDKDSSDLARINKPTDLIYIIYTSGSTGTPKGVMIEHTSVVNRIHWMLNKYPFSNKSVIMQKTTYCFDVSVWELFSWFFVGATLCLLEPGEEKDPGAIIGLIEKQKITAMHFVPSMLSVFLEYVDKKNLSEKLASLVNVFASGEALTLQQVKLFNRLLYEKNGTRLSDLYGPTEATVEVSYYECSPLLPVNTVPIGKPIDNMKLYVLDRYLKPLPVGVPGELYIGGVGVSRGYIHNLNLTSERFVENPFCGGTLYKTGDIVKMLDTGDIAYLGRNDNQVKIHGFRIELGEIENCLLGHDDIEEAVVNAMNAESGDKRLCCYYKARRILQPKDLILYLSGKLPDYMIPAFFIKTDEFPLNRSGKIDRAQLPEPGGIMARYTESIKPRNLTEEIIASAWTSVLNIPAIGIDDNFFELGGDSLSAIKIITILKLGINIVDFYKKPTIRQMAEHLNEGEQQTGLLVNMSKNYNASCRNVICFPFGGGSALTYRDLSISACMAKAALNIYSVNLPGHDYGADNKLMSVDETARKLAAEIIENVSGEIILYAHCVGSALMHATAKILINSGVPIKAVFIGGILPPRFIRLYGRFYRLWDFYNEAQIIKDLKRSGLPDVVFKDKDYTAFMCKAFRHDKKSFIKYFYELMPDKVNQLELPLYLVVGDRDAATKKYKKRYCYWNEYFYNVNLLVLKNTDHYFIRTKSDSIVSYINSI